MVGVVLGVLPGESFGRVEQGAIPAATAVGEERATEGAPADVRDDPVALAGVSLRDGHRSPPRRMASIVVAYPKRTRTKYTATATPTMTLSTTRSKTFITARTLGD